ncbi:MAG TPA: hypothetical protein VLH60_03120 [Sedimentisphaerales bacterium]|nr:hypothetical protein [Sedimentisphaerales bacterium]
MSIRKDKMMKRISIIAAIAMTLLAAMNSHAKTFVNSNITTSTTWTKANSPYHLVGQIYVTPGATLTIEAGVVVASFVDHQGSLAVSRGAKIYVLGTKNEPVIMTSAEDVANWTGSVVIRGGTNNTVSAITTMGDPKTGIWLERCNDWGNLTIMGNAMISASHRGGAPVGSNTKTPTGLNQTQMEGLTHPTFSMYGGPDDDDDSGEIRFLSIRYGGRVIGLANELNGISLGGIGRETDISHVEIMNNVDDGIEIWGGTVGMRYVSIWNIGDDSLDVDQGWRGFAQYGLIVQGHSVNAGQGSGVGDNAIEADGAEASDAQPMTTARITNFTVVGQPIGGDHGVAYRDNARLQIDNSIFMELGEHLIRNDNVDGDGGQGYGHNGTHTWIDTWTTTYNQWIASSAAQVNLGGADLAVLYGQYFYSPADAPLNYLRNSVFFNNPHAAAYTEATARGVLQPANGNVTPATGIIPIQELQRGAPVTRGGLTMLPVTFINPCAANDAVTSYRRSPARNGKDFAFQPYIQPVQFIGGFSPYYNWLEGWTAAYAYGMTDTSMNTPSDPTSLGAIGRGDLNNDMYVDFTDFTILANDWLTRE